MKAAMLSRAVLAALLIATTSALAAPPGQVLHPPAHIEACSPCHGVDGIARDVEVPHLAGQNVVYLYNQLRAFRSGQRKHKEMNYMSRSMTAGEMESLADYFSSLPRQ